MEPRVLGHTAAHGGCLSPATTGEGQQWLQAQGEETRLTSAGSEPQWEAG